MVDLALEGTIVKANEFCPIALAGACAVTMQEITIRVNPTAATVYLSASEQERRKLDALLSLRISEAARQNRPLLDVIRDAGREAAANGLTPEILQEILPGESFV